MDAFSPFGEDVSSTATLDLRSRVAGTLTSSLCRVIGRMFSGMASLQHIIITPGHIPCEKCQTLENSDGVRRTMSRGRKLYAAEKRKNIQTGLLLPS